MTSLTYISLNNYVMDTTTLSQSQTLLSQFLTYCDKSKTQPTSQSLSRFFQNSQPTQIQKPKPKITIYTKKKQVVVIKKKENDYIVFTNNCRNNGFCVQEFQGKPAVFSDYINCPDSKLVVYISNINCTIIKYKRDTITYTYTLRAMITTSACGLQPTARRTYLLISLMYFTNILINSFKSNCTIITLIYYHSHSPMSLCWRCN